MLDAEDESRNPNRRSWVVHSNRRHVVCGGSLRGTGVRGVYSLDMRTSRLLHWIRTGTAFRSTAPLLSQLHMVTDRENGNYEVIGGGRGGAGYNATCVINDSRHTLRRLK